MKTEKKKIILIMLIVFVVCGYAFAEQTIYVDDDGPADFNNIQAAIDDSSDGDTIIVADGTYTGAGNREISFLGKAITVRSENGPENCIIDCQGKGMGFLFRDGEDANSVLAGLTITNGYGSGGGALYISRYSSAMIINCKFENNHSEGYGGAIHCHSYYSPKLINCIVTGNSSRRSGGGMSIAEGSPILTNCTFSGNSAVDWGGAVHCEETSTPTIRNCSIIGNKTEWIGGGISITDASNAIIENCTISHNSANDKGGGIYSDHITTVSNSILWDNSPDQITPNYRLVINHSDVQGGWPGLDNIDVDPLFVDPGYWDANGLWIDGDYHLLEDSPCIDAGNNAAVTVATDLDGNARILNGIVDMGAYEFPAPGQLRELYVDDDAAGANDGSSWADAYNYLQDALAFACSGDEIHVAQGIYTPDGNSAKPNGSGDRSATFQLINGITLKGGYAGFGEPDPNARDIEEYETILSGDLDGNDVAVQDPCDLLNEPTRAENSYHVVRSTRTGETTLLDGFTVTGGNAKCHSAYFGGGMYNKDSSLMVTNCTFSGNLAYEGGGMFNTANCIATLTNCTFIDNFAYDGGAMSNWESNPTLTNCRFSGNSAKWLAGGMCNDTKSCPILNNCTFSGNSANYYAGLHNDNDSYPTLTNCIFWDSRASSDMVQVGDFTSANYSCIQGGWPGQGNIYADPCFVDEANGDYRLLTTSPCIDTGDPNYIVGPNETDLDGKPRVLDGDNDGVPVVDMGAYEYRFAISAEVRIIPKTINLASKGKSITCYIWLPNEYDVTDIEPNSVFFEDEIQPEQFSADQQKQVATATFDREKVQNILNVGDIELTITCQLNDGTSFEATDTIKVTDKAGKN
ncbi:MAG: right-handed parallel beta-helix repeat-containing protein [Sedimentisphaerales bacterium]